jgi:hypothetical protein
MTQRGAGLTTDRFLSGVVTLVIAAIAGSIVGGNGGGR